MKSKLTLFAGLFFLGVPLFAHRLDEYLQAIIVSVGQDQIRASMRLIPGVAVSKTIVSAVDADGNGVLSDVEQQTYARKVIRDLSIAIDGRILEPHVEDVNFPAPTDMREGTGEIHIDFTAKLPSGSSRRALVIQNHHEPGISVYLMNCLEPQDHGIQVVAQSRNQNQSYYRLDYIQSGNQADWRSGIVAVLGLFGGVPSMFRLGMHHIAEGTDHLLFLLALLLPAPLIAVSSRWSAFGSVRHSLSRILQIVTAFTIGHSLTLALGASGLLTFPSRPVEVLIAFSILISAAHAVRPLFSGREPLIAAFFGLIHGLAFAATLQNLGVGAWQRVASVLGFNLGIEAMQLVVVAAILPSLLILSRMSVYAVLRLGGAGFAGLAASGWIIERVFAIQTPVDLMVDAVAHRGLWIAFSLAVTSILLWLHRDFRADQRVAAPAEGVLTQ